MTWNRGWAPTQVTGPIAAFYHQRTTYVRELLDETGRIRPYTTLQGCDVSGPALLVLGDNAHIDGCYFDGLGGIHIAEEGEVIAGGVRIDWVSFIGCRMRDVIVVVPSDMRDEVLARNRFESRAL